MDVELIRSVLSVVAALIPLILLIITIIRSSFVGINQSIDSSSLKIFSIVRNSMKKEEYKKTRIYNLIKFIIYSILYFLIYSLYSWLYINFKLYNIPRFINFAFLILFFIALLLLFYLYRKQWMRGKNLEEFEIYNLYSNADLIMEVNYHYLFNKCHEVLRSMKFTVKFINEADRKLEAFQINIPVLTMLSSYLFPPKRISIIIEFVEGSVSSYKLTIVCTIGEDRYRSSKLMNTFIDKLISKPKGAEEKEQNINVSVGGEG